MLGVFWKDVKDFLKKECERVEINDGDDRVESLWVRINVKANKTCGSLPQATQSEWRGGQDTL